MASTYIKSRIASFGYAKQGIVLFFKTQANGRIQLLAAFITLGLGVWLSISPLEWVAILLCISLVIGAELMNTAIEALADAVDESPNTKIRLTKDFAAGSVLIVAIGATAVGALIFLPKLIALW